MKKRRTPTAQALVISMALMAMAACRSTPKPSAELAIPVVPEIPVCPGTQAAAERLAEQILGHPFPPLGEASATVCLMPQDTSTGTGTPAQAISPLLPALRKQLEKDVRISVIDSPATSPVGRTALPADHVPGQLARIRHLGARYLIEVGHTDTPHPTLVADVTDTTTGMVILRKVTTAP